MPTTICMINQKGGCGKSSVCFHLSGALAAAGKRVLLLDLDPQGSLSQDSLARRLSRTIEAKDTVAKLFDRGCLFRVGRSVGRSHSLRWHFDRACQPSVPEVQHARTGVDGDAAVFGARVFA